MFRLPLRLFGPALVGTALVLLAATPSFAAAATSPAITLENGATYFHPGSGPIRFGPAAVFHLRGHATCPSGHFLYVNNGNAFNNSVSGFVINADCSLTPTPGSPYPTGGNEFSAGWGQNQIATSVANGPCVFSTDSNTSGGSGPGQVVSWSVASTGALTKVSAITIPPAGSDVKVSPDGKYLYAVSWNTPAAISTMTIGSGCTLTLAQTYTATTARYYAITLVADKGLVAPDYNNDQIDVYSITNGTQLMLVSTSPSQVPYPGGAATVLRSPIGPVVLDGSNGASEVEAHTINKQGTLGSVPGSPASDPNATVAANILFDAPLRQVTATEQFNGSQFANSMGIFGAKSGQLALLSHVSLPGSDFPTAQAALGTELYITNELGASVEACVMGKGTATCSLAATLTSGGITQGIGVL
jgi:hypothetical protein